MFNAIVIDKTEAGQT
ncbi:MAG TPA: hypothetical protein PKE25_12405, partial [Novosphingobium sp.]|nr:hypothetical protein [Novosphingobium sp.]